MSTLFEHAGGEEALHHLEQIFYDSVLADPLLQPLFGDGQPQVQCTEGAPLGAPSALLLAIGELLPTPAHHG